MNPKLLTAICLCFTTHTFAQEAFVPHTNTHIEGWVQSQDGSGGRWEKPLVANKDWRAAHPGFFVDKPQQSSFLTVQEEAAYRAELMFRTRKTDALASPTLASEPFIASAHRAKRRFQVRRKLGSDGGFRVVCAPAIAAAEAPTWRDVLKCWDVLKKEVSHD